MNRIEIETYARSLYARVAEARILKRIGINAGIWTAKENMCHHNATELHLHDERYTPIRGWLYFDLSAFGYIKFVSHSAILTPEGEIVDITPRPTTATQDYPFLEGYLSEDEYQELVEERGYSEINLPIGNA